MKAHQMNLFSTTNVMEALYILMHQGNMNYEKTHQNENTP